MSHVQVKSVNYKVFVVSLMMALTIAFFLFQSIKVNQIGFLGIADSKEQQVNFEYPVELKKIYVIAGQIVKKGDLILELDQSALNTQLRDIEFRINRLKSEIKAREQLSSLVLSKNKSKIKIRAQMSISSSQSSLEIEDLKKSELLDLEKEKDVLLLKKRNLYVFSPIDGVIGQINFKVGEKVSEFMPILTLIREAPSFVTGFVNENLDLSLVEGDEVFVMSAARKQVITTGRVVTIGKRTVEIPARLLKFTNIVAFGREVKIEIPNENQFLIGEKVIVKTKNEILSFMTKAKAAKNEISLKKFALQGNFQLHKINIPDQVLQSYRFEPSGLLWAQDLNKFLVVSDDTDEDKNPVVYLLNKDGSVDAQVIKIKNIDKVSDLEAISSDGKYIYLMGSNSQNAKENAESLRNYFIKIERKSLDLQAIAKVDFRHLLINALLLSQDNKLKQLGNSIKNSDKKADDLDIESLVVNNNQMIFALKSPLTIDNETLFLKIDNVDYIFNQNFIHPQQISIAAKFKLKNVILDQFGEVDLRVTDLILNNGAFYIATTCFKNECSAVFRANRLMDSDLKIVQTFSLKKLEGIEFDQDDQLMGVFDEGSKEPYYFYNEK